MASGIEPLYKTCWTWRLGRFCLTCYRDSNWDDFDTLLSWSTRDGWCLSTRVDSEQTASGRLPDTQAATDPVHYTLVVTDTSGRVLLRQEQRDEQDLAVNTGRVKEALRSLWRAPGVRTVLERRGYTAPVYTVSEFRDLFGPTQAKKNRTRR